MAFLIVATHQTKPTVQAVVCSTNFNVPMASVSTKDYVAMVSQIVTMGLMKSTVVCVRPVT